MGLIICVEQYRYTKTILDRIVGPRDLTSNQATSVDRMTATQ
jgi:hypothetical protein